LGDDIIQTEENKKKLQDKIWQLVQKTFKPEFINRLDQIVLFEKLTKKQISQVVDLQIKRIQENLWDNRQLKIIVDESAKTLIAKLGYDPQFGARPLKRVIQTNILDKIALMIIEGKIKEGETIKVNGRKNQFSLKIKN